MMRLRSANVILAVTLLVPAVAGDALGDRLRNVNPGEPLPPFRCTLLDGRTLDSEQLTGRVLVLVYLSAGQSQSEKALASAHKVVEAIKSKELALVFMSADADKADYFRELRQRLEVNEPLALGADREYYGRLGLIAFPTTIVTSKKGKLLHVIASWTRDYEYRLDLYCRHALGQLDDEALAERLTAHAPPHDDARSKADRHRAMAAILRSKGRTAAAIHELEQALALDPDSGAAAVDLAELLVAEGKVDEAEQRINALLARQPDYQGAKLIVGLISLKRGQLDKAEKLLTSELEMYPDPVRVHYYLGQLYEAKGEYKRAMEHYRDALKQALNEP
jgi:tetratricopeptide (TPR) repeat protein